MDFETLRVTLQDHVAHIELNRPTRLNAINAVMKRELHQVFDRIDTDDDIGAVVVSGAGRAFSAGMDLKDDAAGSTEGVAAWRQALAGDPHDAIAQARQRELSYLQSDALMEDLAQAEVRLGPVWQTAAGH